MNNTIDDKVDSAKQKKKPEEQEPVSNIPMYFRAKFTEKDGKITVDPSLGIPPGAYAPNKKKHTYNKESKEEE